LEKIDGKFGMFCALSTFKTILDLPWHLEIVKQLKEVVGQIIPRFSLQEKEEFDLGSHSRLYCGGSFAITAQPNDISIWKKGHAG
jgi:hypothetical protein